MMTGTLHEVTDFLSWPPEADAAAETASAAAGSFRHGRRIALVAGAIGAFDREGKDDAAGGWWIATNVEVEYGRDELARHDLAGWRRERLLAEPDETPVKLRPDWVCEIVSKDVKAADTIRKLRALQKAKVPHVWVQDLVHETLSVYRWQKDGYLVVQQATAGETLRLEPFDSMELSVSTLLGAR